MVIVQGNLILGIYRHYRRPYRNALKSMENIMHVNLKRVLEVFQVWQIPLNLESAKSAYLEAFLQRYESEIQCRKKWTLRWFCMSMHNLLSNIICEAIKVTDSALWLITRIRSGAVHNVRHAILDQFWLPSVTLCHTSPDPPKVRHTSRTPDF